MIHYGWFWLLVDLSLSLSLFRSIASSKSSAKLRASERTTAPPGVIYTYCSKYGIWYGLLYDTVDGLQSPAPVGD